MAPGISRASDFDSLCADRGAIERVYYHHRLGTKPPFEQIMPRELIEKLVRQDLHKEAVLKKVHGVDITGEMLTAEARRIDSTTRAPDILVTVAGMEAMYFSRKAPRRAGRNHSQSKIRLKGTQP